MNNYKWPEKQPYTLQYGEYINPDAFQEGVESEKAKEKRRQEEADEKKRKHEEEIDAQAHAAKTSTLEERKKLPDEVYQRLRIIEGNDELQLRREEQKMAAKEAETPVPSAKEARERAMDREFEKWRKRERPSNDRGR